MNTRVLPSISPPGSPRNSQYAPLSSSIAYTKQSYLNNSQENTPNRVLPSISPPPSPRYSQYTPSKQSQLDNTQENVTNYTFSSISPPVSPRYFQYTHAFGPSYSSTYEHILLNDNDMINKHKLILPINEFTLPELIPVEGKDVLKAKPIPLEPTFIS